MSNSFWIIATFGVGVVAVAAILLNVALLYFARKEGRFFIRKGWGGKGLDLLRVEPNSNKVELLSLEWGGNVWKHGKEGMMAGLDLISNPENTDSNETYNKFIREANTWKGSKRPVVIATDIMSTIFNPGFIGAANKGESLTELDPSEPPDDTILGKIKKWWGKPAQPKKNTKIHENPKTLIEHYQNWASEQGLETITFLEIIKPTDLKKHLKDIGPKRMRDQFLKGVEAQKLANTKPPGERQPIPGAWLWLILMAVLFIAGYFLLQSDLVAGLL